MKILLLLLSSILLLSAIEESKQLKSNHPLQEKTNSSALLCTMSADMQVYLHETPLSSYDFFNKKTSSTKSQALITWIHGDIYLQNLGVGKESFTHVTLNNEKQTHLGDYRYDLFTLLNDLLIQMQENSDFSGSKEKAILGKLVDGYFERIENEKLQCACIDEAVEEVDYISLLNEYTKVVNNHRIFKPNQLKTDVKNTRNLEHKMNAYLKGFKLLPLKGIALNAYGDYLLLCEGKSTKLDDDIIFILSAKTLPVSYQINVEMKQKYLKKTSNKQIDVISSFNQNNYAGTIELNSQKFFVSKLSPKLSLHPDTDNTKVYKNYASALGYMLASFHANSELQVCNDFSKKAQKQIKKHLVRNEMISMVYSYNERLENNLYALADKINCQ
jgi:hypothetical protein